MGGAINPRSASFVGVRLVAGDVGHLARAQNALGVALRCRTGCHSAVCGRRMGRIVRGMPSGKLLFMTSNNSLERQSISGGRPVLATDCVLAGAEMAPWRAAQQDR